MLKAIFWMIVGAVLFHFATAWYAKSMVAQVLPSNPFLGVLACGLR